MASPVRADRRAALRQRHAVLADGTQYTAPRALDRTASFAFYVGNRYFGVITASVRGQAAAGYAFTSELPLAVLRQLAPLIERRLATARSGPSLAAAVEPGELRRVAAE